MRAGTFDIILCLLFGIVLPLATPLFIWLIEESNNFILDKFNKKEPVEDED